MVEHRYLTSNLLRFHVAIAGPSDGRLILLLQGFLEYWRPFFLYGCMVVPHANNERTDALKNGAEVPDFGSYAGEAWPEPDKGQAAMISRLDVRSRNGAKRSGSFRHDPWRRRSGLYE